MSVSPAALTNADPGIRALSATSVALARQAIEQEWGASGSRTDVGDFVAAFAEDDIAVTAQFRCTAAAYAGWYWAVTLAFADPLRPTVSEVVLLPGAGALVAPQWVPWSERLRSGDLSPGDLLPTAPDDPRLVPGYVRSDDRAVEDLAAEVGLGRVRVMSRDGRSDLAERIHEGGFGPESPMALGSSEHCGTCGFYLPLAGSLGNMFGACGNEISPADGRVVDAGYGCGAHSELVIAAPALSAAPDFVIDELVLDVHPRPEALEAPEGAEPSELLEPLGFLETLELPEPGELPETLEVAAPLEATGSLDATEPLEATGFTEESDS